MLSIIYMLAKENIAEFKKANNLWEKLISRLDYYISSNQWSPSKDLIQIQGQRIINLFYYITVKPVVLPRQIEKFITTGDSKKVLYLLELEGNFHESSVIHEHI